jgi:transposase
MVRTEFWHPTGHSRTQCHRRPVSSAWEQRLGLAAADSIPERRLSEETLRELKLLVDHRDDLVAERHRCQQRLRWHLHELDPTLQVPLGVLDRAVWLDRLGRQLARREQTTQVRIARELLGRGTSVGRARAAAS